MKTHHGIVVALMSNDQVNILRQRVRLVVLLDAAEAAGLAPIRILWLHAFAYLSNVLAPVWDLPMLDDAVLKQQGGPFYPRLQHDLDRLVGIGVANVSAIGHVKDLSGRWRLDGAYRLNRTFADPILSTVRQFEEEHRVATFLHELGYALSALSDEDLDMAVSEDATYSDRMITYDNVVDFGSLHGRNYTAAVAHEFSSLMPGGNATSGEKLHLYVRHLHRRIHGER